MPYCSLACFRSPDHAACTDTFDRTTLVQDLEADKGKSQGEKNKMLELLQKFEEQQRELEEIERAEKEDDEADQSPEAVARRREREELEKRLEGVDLGALLPLFFRQSCQR